MNIMIRVCCSSFDQNLCAEMGRILGAQFGSHNVQKVDDTYEHTIETTATSYSDAETITDKLFEESNGRIALVDYIVTSHK